MILNIGSRTYKRILMILLVSFEVTLLLCAVAFFCVYRYISIREIDRLNSNIVSKASINIRYMNDFVNKYCMLIFNDNIISPLIYSDESGLDFNEEITIINRMHNMTEAYGIIDSVIIYNGVNKKLYSWDENYLKDEYIAEVMKNAEGHIKPEVRELPPNVYYNNKSVITYVVSEPLGTNGFMLVNVDAQWLENTLSNSSNDSSILIVADYEGTIVAQSRNGRVEKIPDDLLKKMRSGVGHVAYKSKNGSENILMYKYIEDSDLIFISINTYKNTYSVLKRILIWTISIMLLFGMVGLLIVLFAGKKIYNPVRVLAAKAEGLFGVKKYDKDEIDYLYEVFQHNSEMNKPNFAVVIRELMLEGEYLDYDMEKCMELSEKLKDIKSMILIYIKTPNIDKLDGVFDNINCELVIIHRSDTLVVVTDPAENISRTLMHISEICPGAIVCTSDVFDKTADINRCYKQMEGNSAYSLIYDKNVITSNLIQVNKSNSDELIYPQDVLKELRKHLLSSDMDVIISCFENFLEIISKNIFNNYLIALVKLIMDLFDDEYVPSSNRKEYYVHQIFDAKRREDIIALFYGLFDEIIPLYRRNKESPMSTINGTKAGAIVDAVKIVANNRYYDASLCIASIADEMKMSPGYIGKLFKQIEGISIADYINKLRIDEAAKMLASTDYSVKKVMEQVGYVNESTFYSKFKKYTGMTPKEFRFIASDSSV